MKKFTLCLKLLILPALSMFLLAFTSLSKLEDYVKYLQDSFSQHYDATQEINEIKRYELNVTNTGFCRYKRFYSSGKIEYFAFKLAKFKDLDYYGTSTSGKLFLRTKSDDVIVQTYNDKKGDVDSMATYIVIPMKNIEVEDLTKIKECLTPRHPEGGENP